MCLKINRDEVGYYYTNNGVEVMRESIYQFNTLHSLSQRMHVGDSKPIKGLAIIHQPNEHNQSKRNSMRNQ